MVKSRKQRGRGYSVSPANMVSVGNPVYQAYSGAGKDCSGEAVRPGWISSGGKRRRGGALGVAPIALPGDANLAAPAAPALRAQNDTHMGPAIALRAQNGGRYGSDLGAPLDPNQAIGMSSYAPIQHVPCEASRAGMHGGAASLGQDTAIYRAPTAGYGHGFETYPGTSAVGGLMINTPYEARASNPACHTTGGRRKSQKQRKSQRKQRKQRKSQRKQRKSQRKQRK